MRVGLGFLLALAGGLLFSAGVIGYWRNAGATADPETISLHDLLARWPRGNPHVRITDFHLCNRFSKWGSAKRQEWRAYIPLVPAQPGVPAGAILMPEHFPAIFVTRFVGRDSPERLREARALQGLVTSHFTDLPSGMQTLLREAYPRTDFSRVLIIEDAQVPEPVGTAWLLMGLGALLLVPVVPIALRVYRRFREESLLPEFRGG
jgi:hypothetical protein